MKPKNLNFKFLPFGFCFLFSKENTGQVIYITDMYAVVDQKTPPKKQSLPGLPYLFCVFNCAE